MPKTIHGGASASADTNSLPAETHPVAGLYIDGTPYESVGVTVERTADGLIFRGLGAPVVTAFRCVKPLAGKAEVRYSVSETGETVIVHDGWVDETGEPGVFRVQGRTETRRRGEG